MGEKGSDGKGEKRAYGKMEKGSDGKDERSAYGKGYWPTADEEFDSEYWPMTGDDYWSWYWPMKGAAFEKGYWAMKGKAMADWFWPMKGDGFGKGYYPMKGEACGKGYWSMKGGTWPFSPYDLWAAEDPSDEPTPTKKRKTAGGKGNSDAIEVFLSRHEIQDHAAQQLRELSPDLQRLVMDAGSLNDARDPTAVLCSRINKAQEGSLTALQKNPGDWECARCGHYNFARNAACRECGAPVKNPLRQDQTEAFLGQTELDEVAIQQFWDLSPTLQKLVIDAGPLTSARDPSAVLFARMKKARTGTLKVEEVRPGDWTCPGCGNHNFARNEVCRNCGQ